MKRMPTDEEMIAEIERQRADGTDLDGLIPVKAKVVKNPRAVFSLRLSKSEVKAIEDAALSRGVTMGDFIRDAAIMAAASEHLMHPEPTATWMSVQASMEVLLATVAATKRQVEQAIEQKASSNQ